MAYPQKRGKVYYAYVKMPPNAEHPEPWYKSFSKHPETGARWTSKTAAREWGREHEAKVNKKSWVDPELGEMTWNELWKQWNPHGDGDLVTVVDENTADFYRDLYATHIGPRWGRDPIGDAKLATVTRWLKALGNGTIETGPEEKRRRQAYAPRTTDGIRKLMVLMLNDAVDEGILDANPLALKSSRRGQRRGRRVDHLQVDVRPKMGATPEQALALAVNIHQAIGPGSLAGMAGFMRTLTAFWSAIRPGEQAALDPANCLVNGTAQPKIHVHPKLGNWEQRRGQPPRLKAPKGGLGRDAIVPLGFAAVLTAWLEFLERSLPACDIAFPTHETKRWNRHNWEYRWNRAATGGVLELRGPNRWTVAGTYILERAMPGLEPKGARRVWNVWATECGIPDIARETQLGHSMSDELQAAYSLMSAVLEEQIRTAFQSLWVDAFAGYAGVRAMEIIGQFAPSLTVGRGAESEALPPGARIAVEARTADAPGSPI